MHRIRGKLTYANVIATIALFIALGGASYAAVKLPKNSVGTNQIKKNAVTTAKIKDGAVTGAKINASTLGTVPNANSANSATTAKSADNATNAKTAENAGHAATADNATHAATADSATTAKTADAAPPIGAAGGSLAGTYPKPTIAAKAVGNASLAEESVSASKLAAEAVASAKLAKGAVNAASLGQITKVNENFTGAMEYVHSPGSLNELFVECPSGTRVISGGFQSGVIGGYQPSGDYMRGNGWSINGRIPGSTNVTVSVYAYCLG